MLLLAANAAVTALLLSARFATAGADVHPHLRGVKWADAPLEERVAEALLRQPGSVEESLQKRDWSIPTGGLPPLPVVDWLLANDTSWPRLANAGVRRMQTWFDPEASNYTGYMSWWQHPVLLLSYIDLDTAQGDRANEQLVTTILNKNNRGVDYIIDAYVDDQAWWGLAAVKAYQLYGNAEWLEAAKSIQNNDTQYWTDTCGGGLLWLTYKPEFGKNTITNTKSYLDDAVRTYDWWASWAYDESTGEVWDTINADCSKKYNQLFTYNSGVILGALVDMFTATKNPDYLATAKNIAMAAMRDFSTAEGVMKEGCESDGPPDNSGRVSAARILAQNLGYLYQVDPDPVIYKYLSYNFLMSSFFNMDSTFKFGEFWGGPFEESLANELTQANSLGLMSAGVSVNLARSNANRLAAGLGPAIISEVFLLEGGFESMAVTQADATGDLLCLILDLNPIAWALSGKMSPEGDILTLESALDQLIIFCNAHLALRHENALAVFAAGFGKSRLLFSSQLTPLTSSTRSASADRDSNTYQQFRMVDEKIVLGVKEVMAVLPEEGGLGTVGLVGALAMALCHVNRLDATESLSTALLKPKPRICIISVTEDASSQYVPIMNCIFAAQKVNIPIDVCKVFGPDAVFLQQACHLTTGSYYKLARRSGLLQYLLMAFLPGPTARKQLNQPTQDQVDLRAACFCHRRIIDVGYVCSVCLSIFCTPLPVCTTCRTKFPMSTLKRLGMGAKPPGGANGAARPKKRKAVEGSATPGSRAGTPLPTATPAPE